MGVSYFINHFSILVLNYFPLYYYKECYDEYLCTYILIYALDKIIISYLILPCLQLHFKP